MPTVPGKRTERRGLLRPCAGCSPASNHSVLQNVQNCKRGRKEKRKMMAADEQKAKREPRTLGRAPEAVLSRPTPLPAAAAAPRAPRPRSAGLSASGSPCAAALTRVTSGPAPRTDRRAGAEPLLTPPITPPIQDCVCSIAARANFPDLAATMGY